MLHDLFAFRGRIGRGTMWAVYLMCCGLLGLFIPFVFILQTKLPRPMRFFDGTALWWPASHSGKAIVVLSAAVVVVIFVALLAAVVKRLHDRGKSAWWLALFYGVPAVFFVAILFLGWPPGHAFPGQAVVVSMLFVASWLLALWYIIEILFLPGTRGDNRFGPDPLRIDGPKGAA